eukprot:952862_1
MMADNNSDSTSKQTINHKHQSNGRKRKRSVSDKGGDGELLLKKRKLNDEPNFNDLLHRIRVLTKQNKELRQSMHEYKAKYFTILHQIEPTNTNDKESSPSPPLRE